MPIINSSSETWNEWLLSASRLWFWDEIQGLQNRSIEKFDRKHLDLSLKGKGTLRRSKWIVMHLKVNHGRAILEICWLKRHKHDIWDNEQVAVHTVKIFQKINGYFELEDTRNGKYPSAVNILLANDGKPY